LELIERFNKTCGFNNEYWYFWRNHEIK
jgi:hypothetical protein